MAEDKGFRPAVAEVCGSDLTRQEARALLVALDAVSLGDYAQNLAAADKRVEKAEAEVLRLRGENERLRGALRKVANPDNEYFHDVSDGFLEGWDWGREWAQDIAQAVLDGDGS